MSAFDVADEDSPKGRRNWPAQRAQPLVKNFTFYIDDDRYSVPTLNIVAMADEARARAWAQSAMRENPHYLGVEICEDGKRLFGLGSLADRAGPD